MIVMENRLIEGSLVVILSCTFATGHKLKYSRDAPERVSEWRLCVVGLVSQLQSVLKTGKLLSISTSSPGALKENQNGSCD